MKMPSDDEARRRPVRLQDVAEHAGVSMKTISNVVNGYQHVSPEMRARVKGSIDALGYRPNLAARRLASGRTGAIAVALPEINVPYFAELARTLYDTAAERGLRVIIEQTISGPDGERSSLQDRDQGFVDGVIMHPVRLSVDDLNQLSVRYPIVLLGEGDSPDQIDHVFIDNNAAIAESVAHLVALGKRRIAFLGREQDTTTTTRSRLHGYNTALAMNKISYDPRLVLDIDWFTAADGERAVVAAIDAGLEFDAVLCRDDVLAIGALRALHNAGLVVPDQVAVIGWDDIANSAFTFPSLTTIRPNMELLARTALELLSERIAGHRGAGRHRVIPHHLVIRESAPSGLPAGRLAAPAIPATRASP